MNPESQGSYNSPNGIKQKDLRTRQDVTLHLVKRKLDTFKTTVIRDVENKMDEMMDGLVQEIQHYEVRTNEFKDFAMEEYNQIWSNRKLRKNSIDATADSSTNSQEHLKVKSKKLPEKIFMPRESYLTALLEVSHMKSIYNFFYVILIFVVLHNGLHDYFVEGRINIGLETVAAAFGKFEIASLIWTCLLLAAIGLFYAFNIWATIRNVLKFNDALQSMWSYGCIIIFISFLNIFFYTACILCPKLDLPLISSCCVLMESCRLVMKMHAFVRTSAARQIQGKLKTEDDVSNLVPTELPKFSNYLYFLFAPTLIYRDSYPRTKQIRWKFALTRLLEVFSIILLLSHTHERHMRPIFIDFCKTPFTSGAMVVSIFGMMMPGFVTMLCGFYCILHAWMNFAAEILRFGDRMFYRDWWTSGNYSTYYRHWNIVVHDYLYEYIFRDVYYLTNGSKVIATTTVFLVSAIIHEIILSFGLRFFYPVMFFFFMIIGGTLIIVTKKTSHTVGNMIIIAGCAMGNGSMMAFYFMEYYARQNCNVGSSFWDYIVPVSWSCSNVRIN